MDDFRAVHTFNFAVRSISELSSSSSKLALSIYR